jgi:predicted AlkP superfamily pyrophosphatase or phosphodiesterase
MKTWKLSIFAALFAIAGFSFCHASEKAPHVLMISIDSLRPDFYLEAEFPAPTLKALVSQGSFAQSVVPQFPTVTYPNHTSLVSGVPTGIHGILSNTVFDWTVGPTPKWYWWTQDIKVPTLWGQAKTAGLTVGSVRWPVSVGAPGDFMIPEMFSINAPIAGPDGKIVTLDANGKAVPGWTLTVEHMTSQPLKQWMNTYPTQDVDNADKADVFVRDATVHILKTYNPNLMTVHLANVDHAQHASGPESDETKAALEVADSQVKDILAAVDLSQTCVFIVGDHGFSKVSKSIAINKLFVDKGWITLEADGKAIKSWTVMAHSSGGQAAIYTKDDNLKKDIMDVLETNASGLYNIIDQAELKAFGAYPKAVAAIEGQPGYVVSSAISNTLVGKSSVAGQHGYSPKHKELHTGFIAVGCGMAHKDLGEVNILDIAPTVARTLGVALPKSSGKVLPLR